jgi:HAD superfamily hydrolase (TIGR01509 family)
MQQLEDYEAFIFDLDGTLIDSGKYHAQAFADAVFHQSGYVLTPAEHLEVFAGHSLSFCPQLNERYGLSLDPSAVLAEKRTRVQEIFKADLFSGALEFLDKWHGVHPFGLATNSPLAFVRPALEEVGIYTYFDSITTADDVTQRKPHPEVFEIAFQKLSVDPSKTIVFEDQLIGIEAAHLAGAQVVVINNGQQVVFPPDIPVRTWKELLVE